MCRLLAFTSLERKSFYDVVGADFDKFVALSAEHKDGWGMAHDGNILKDLKPAVESPELNQSASTVMTDGALLHLRLASKELLSILIIIIPSLTVRQHLCITELFAQETPPNSS